VVLATSGTLLSSAAIIIAVLAPALPVRIAKFALAGVLLQRP